MRALKQPSFICLISTAVLLMLLSGCGQRGPLYLPTDPATQNQNTEQGDNQDSPQNIDANKPKESADALLKEPTKGPEN